MLIPCTWWSRLCLTKCTLWYLIHSFADTVHTICFVFMMSPSAYITFSHIIIASIIIIILLWSCCHWIPWDIYIALSSLLESSLLPAWIFFCFCQTNFPCNWFTNNECFYFISCFGSLLQINLIKLLPSKVQKHNSRDVQYHQFPFLSDTE